MNTKLDDTTAGRGDAPMLKEGLAAPSDDNVRKGKLHMIAGKIAELRRDRGWSQAELARRAGLNRNVVNTTENETSFPTRENLQRIANALSINLHELTDVYVQEAHHKAPAALNITEAQGRPGHVWVQVNRMLKTATALKVFELIANDDTDPSH